MYAKSQEIELRLANLLSLIQKETHSTDSLASALRVSKPTIARCITALRKRGYVINARKNAKGWRYELCLESLPINQKGGTTER